MKDNLKDVVGMLVGAGILICGVLLVFLTVAQPSLLLQGEEWTLIDILDNNDGLWMNENDDLKIDSVEDYEVGEMYETEVEIDSGIVLLGVVFIMIGLVFIVGHSRIE